MKKENYRGDVRQVGFEIEYAGLSLDDVADTVIQLFDGVIRKEHEALYKIDETTLGDFVLELDAIPLQKIAKSNQQLEKSIDITDRLQHQLGKAIGGIGAKVAPYEIVCPPVAVTEINTLQELCDRLREKGVEGTKESFYYAFGLHINPDVTSLESVDIVRHIQSFLLLSPWLIREHAIDLSRRMTRFIDPFTKEYASLVLDENYKPDIDNLIRDYHTHNPTRNRALDMLPLFAFQNEELVRDLYGEAEKINARPTFHYRLANCEIGDKSWSLDLEWKRWCIVEAVATNVDLLQSLLKDWHAHQDAWLVMESDWVKMVDQRIEELDV